MDYTPIHVRRVLTAFGLTVMVALLPAAIGLVRSGLAGRLMPETLAGHGLTFGSGAALVLLGLAVVWSVVHFGRRLVRRPSRA